MPDSLAISVGGVGLGDFDPDERSAAIGGAIGRPYWGQSIATHAGKLAISYAFQALQLESIRAVVLARNDRVTRLLNKLGFERQSAAARHPSAEASSDSFLYVLRRSAAGDS